MTAKYEQGDKVLILNSGTDASVNHFLKVGTIAEVTGQDFGDYWYIRGEDEKRGEEISQIVHENSFRLINESDEKQEEQTEQPEGFTITLTKDEVVYLYGITYATGVSFFKNLFTSGNKEHLVEKLKSKDSHELAEILDAVYEKILVELDSKKEVLYDVLTEDCYGGRRLQHNVQETLYNDPDWQSSYKILWSEKKEV